jgi:hypothetical protein
MRRNEILSRCAKILSNITLSEQDEAYVKQQLRRLRRDTAKKGAVVVATNSEAKVVAEYLLKSILAWKPNFKQPTQSQLNRWASDIDKAMRLDNRTPDELIGAIDWMQTPAGSFWRPNILSGKKLREKFDTMEAQSMKPSKSTAFQEGLDLIDAMKREAGVL